VARVAGEGREILVTGCSSGIGRCVADGLRRRGYRVFASARRPEDVERLESEGHEALWLDLADPTSVRGAVEEVLARAGGRLYGLFNNGGYGQPGALEDLSREVLRQQLETNVLGWHQLSAAVLPAMRAAGQGRIIQNGSLLGFIALRYRGAYVTSKYAIEGWSDTLRLELAGTGIHVSVIEPGPVTSRFRENAHAAFRRYVDVPSSPHREDYRAVEERLRSPARVPFELPPEAVLAKVVHALESARPKPRYHVTVPTHAFAALRRLLPQRAMHALLAWVSRRENRS
jgi:NAD(P)-dependent dehydrogenase (short-subunit alcohol dehydrogenase family)